MCVDTYSTIFVMVLCSGRARRQRAHHQHTTAPLPVFQKELVRKTDSDSRSERSGWDGMILPGCEDPYGDSERASEIKWWLGYSV
jgi:hypothetical protein